MRPHSSSAARSQPRDALRPLWTGFAGALDVGESPQTAAIIKLLHNQMLLVQLAVIAETLRAGRAAGIDDATLATTLRESPMMPAGLNRIDVFFDPDHAGWFSTVQGAKDVTLFLDLAEGGHPAGYRRRARRLPAGCPGRLGKAGHHRLGRIRPAPSVTGAKPRSVTTPTPVHRNHRGIGR